MGISVACIIQYNILIIDLVTQLDGLLGEVIIGIKISGGDLQRFTLEQLCEDRLLPRQVLPIGQGFYCWVMI